MHGCPCGFFSDPTHECRCTGAIIQRYLSKVSGPLLDRIDLHIEVPAVAYKELRGKDNGVSSADMRTRVENARVIQQRSAEPDRPGPLTIERHSYIMSTLQYERFKCLAPQAGLGRRRARKLLS